MNNASRKIQRIYLTLLLFNTLAASFIWGINTLFLLDAGLSNAEAFAANAFFTAGLVVFEIPTGAIADTRGRRTSYLLGTLTLSVSTILYLLMWQMSGPFWAWAASSMLLGVGFAFFSGAVDAWLVDALTFSGYKGQLETVFAKGQIVMGVAMLAGSVGGGLVAQLTNIGVPYLLRAGILVVSFILAFALMRDVGFTPVPSKTPLKEVKHVLTDSVAYGLRNRAVRWTMLAGFFTGGVVVYAFYAMQPYLLELYGDSHAYFIAGLAAAIIALAQIAGGLVAPLIARAFQHRTSILITGIVLSAVSLALLGLVPHFWAVLGVLVLWALLFAAVQPVRQVFLNGLITSEKRATVLSFDSLLNSAGGALSQPALGKSADVWGYPASYLFCSVIQIAALPFALSAKREKAPSDAIHTSLTAGKLGAK